MRKVWPTQISENNYHHIVNMLILTDWAYILRKAKVVVWFRKETIEKELMFWQLKIRGITKCNDKW